MTLTFLMFALFVCCTVKATAASERTLKQREHRQLRTLHADRGSLRFCHHHPRARAFCTGRRLRFLRARVGWVSRELAETRAALNPWPPHYHEWLCLHSHEGAWTDPNPPFYGGLQMDYEFQSTYGPELLKTLGTADHWSPIQQMRVAERAWLTRGFSPWPNTRRMCGI